MGTDGVAQGLDYFADGTGGSLHLPHVVVKVIGARLDLGLSREVLDHSAAGTGRPLHCPPECRRQGAERRDERDKSLVTSMWIKVARNVLQANMICPLGEELLVRFYPLQTIS